MPQKTQKKKKRLSIEVISQLLTLSTSGFGLVAALAWNNVIQEFVSTYVKKFFPSGSGIISLILYACTVTFIAVFVTYQLSAFKEKIEA